MRRRRAPTPRATALLQYTIEEDGDLTARRPARASRSAPADDLAITPDGRSLYVAGGDLALFDLDAGGLAAPKTPAAVDLVKANGVVVSPNQAPVAHFDVAGRAGGQRGRLRRGRRGGPGRLDHPLRLGLRRRQHAGERRPAGRATSMRSPGYYEVRLVVTDNEGASTLTTFTGSSVLGNGSPAAAISRVIQVAAPALPLPPAIVPAQPARPELGETVIVEPAAGRVRVRLPGEENFVNLRTCG